MQCVYPAQFYFEDGGRFSVVFVDFPGCVTQGENLYDALTEAKDALEFWLSTLEDDGKTIPPATDFKQLKVDGEQFPVPIPADTDAWRHKNRRT